jgi:hypothetical protein
MIAPSVHVVSKDIDTLMGFLMHTASVLYPAERILFWRQYSQEETVLACGDLPNPVMQIEGVPHGEDLNCYRTFRIPSKSCSLKPHFSRVRDCLSSIIAEAAAEPDKNRGGLVGLEFKIFTRQPGEYGIVIGLTIIKLGG